jgi:hypothetical protein
MKRKMNLQLFAEGSGGNEGGAGGAGGNEPNQGGAGGNEPNQGGEGGAELFKGTQQDVNNIVARETKKAQEKLLKEFGFEDFEGAKDGIEKYRQHLESQKSEGEKQTEALQKATNKNDELTKENDSLKSQLSALKAGVSPDSLDDVIALAQNYLSDDVGFEDAIKKVVEKYPQFAGGDQGGSGKGTFRTNQSNQGGGASGLDPVAEAFYKQNPSLRPKE